MTGATIVLVPIAFATWPAAPVRARPGTRCSRSASPARASRTCVYFHLVAVAGPARAMTVTFVIPIFGILWGAVFLGEQRVARHAGRLRVMLVGTALATGVIKRLPWIGTRRADT